MQQRRPIQTAEILAVGSELVVGETRDTNSADLARELSGLGVEVGRMSQLPDDLAVVTAALTAALARTDLVVTSGGLGPTPDDLTREAIAAVLGVEPYLDPGLERWLEGLWSRRGMAFPVSNRKQAWLIPGSVALANPNGTAPGWWVDAPDAVIVALPGPPRELLPMWSAEVLPRLRARGLGTDRAAETLRLAGIGESAVADLLGTELLHSERPHVATYARLDAVDVRVWATGDAHADARTIVHAGVARVERLVGSYVFARGTQTWPEALGARLGGRTVATFEAGTAGQLAALVGDAPWLRLSEHVGDAPAGMALAARCSELRLRAATDVGLAVAARAAGDDLAVEVAVDLEGDVRTTASTAFRGGEIGRHRAATNACAELWRRLGG
jgi:molybdenum cofactor synthesis domain-containing protein